MKILKGSYLSSDWTTSIKILDEKELYNKSGKFAHWNAKELDFSDFWIEHYPQIKKKGKITVVGENKGKTVINSIYLANAMKIAKAMEFGWEKLIVAPKRPTILVSEPQEKKIMVFAIAPK